MAWPIAAHTTISKIWSWLRPDALPAAMSSSVIITVRVESHPDNRFIVVEAESETAYRSSMEQMDGESSARTHVFRWRGLPEGQYAIRTTLVRAGGARMVARSQMHVISTRPGW